jgi:molybdopterin synthase sulfur carrier subunit
MTVLIRLPQALSVDAGGQRSFEVEVAPDCPLVDVLVEVSARYPALGRRIRDETGEIRRFVNVYVGDDESRALQGLATPVPAGTAVFVVGSVAGG